MEAGPEEAKCAGIKRPLEPALPHVGAATLSEPCDPHCSPRMNTGQAKSMV